MKYLNTVFILFLAFGLTAQITTGSLVMEITDVRSTMPGGEQMVEMMKGSEMSMHFTPEKQVTVMTMKMMGMDMITRNYLEGNMNTSYMDMMGQKIKTSVDMEDTTHNGIELDKLAEAFKVTYDKSDTKEILGHSCYKAEIIMDMSAFANSTSMQEGMEKTKMTAYLTDDIKMYNFEMKEFKGLEFQGTPLFMSIDAGLMKMTYEATSFSKDVDPSIFVHPKGDYKEMDPAMLRGLGIKRD